MSLFLLFNRTKSPKKIFIYLIPQEDFQICQLFFCQFSKNFLYERLIKIIINTKIADIHFFVNFCQFDIHFFVNFVN